MRKFLESIEACKDAREWAGDKDWQEIFDTCHRGDWLLWLYKRTNQGDLRKFTLAKAHCANTVRHLMKDERSVKAVDTAIKFGNGECDIEELNAAAADAADAAAADAAAADAAAAAADAAYAAADADAADAAAADAAYAAYAAADAAYAAAAAYAIRQNQMLTADICRKYLPIEIWNINL